MERKLLEKFFISVFLYIIRNYYSFFQAADFSADFGNDYGVDPNDRDPGDEPHIEDDVEEEEEDYNDQMMEVQPDVVIHDDLNDPDEVEPDEQPDDNGE